MILWYGLLILFAFLSLLIDLNFLPQEILRHVWNLLALGVGVYLLVRMRMKIRMGSYEKMQKEYSKLRCSMDDHRYEKLNDCICKLEERLAALEGKD